MEDLSGSCGHEDAGYVVMECGDPYTEVNGHEATGCYAHFAVCKDCIDGHTDGEQAERWWQAHRLVCPVGYRDQAQLRERLTAVLLPFAGQTVTPEVVDQMVDALMRYFKGGQ